MIRLTASPVPTHSPGTSGEADRSDTWFAATFERAIDFTGFGVARTGQSQWWQTPRLPGTGPDALEHMNRDGMEPGNPAGRTKCGACREGTELPFPFTMAFQPIVNIRTGHAWGYEALVRGINGEGAYSVLDQVSDELVYAFDQACRVRAIELAGDKIPPDGKTRLSINFKPNAVYEPTACIQATLNAARRGNFNPRQLMFEFTEDEPMRDVNHVRRIVETYRSFGFMTAVDDFGAGYAGLSLLADLLPDLIKLDMSLLRGIDSSEPRRRIVHAVVQMTQALGIACLAEGLETREEVETVRDLGIELCQGYYFAKPSIGQLPEVPVKAFQ